MRHGLYQWFWLWSKLCKMQTPKTHLNRKYFRKMLRIYTCIKTYLYVLYIPKINIGCESSEKHCTHMLIKAAQVFYSWFMNMLRCWFFTSSTLMLHFDRLRVVRFKNMWYEVLKIMWYGWGWVFFAAADKLTPSKQLYQDWQVRRENLHVDQAYMHEALE